eukprot:5416249-Pyramimonas_sp.AAC.1
MGPFACDLCGYESSRAKHISPHRGTKACLRRRARAEPGVFDGNLARSIDRQLPPFVAHLKANVAACRASAT